MTLKDSSNRCRKESILENNKNKSINQKAVDYFNQGFNCAESALLALSDYMDIDCRYIPKIASGFGGGIGKHGEVCGALSGAVMALGIAFGRKEANDREGKEKMYNITDSFIKKFEKEFGCIRCKDLTGYDMLNPEDLKKMKEENTHKNFCSKLVSFAVLEASKIITT